jgi:hypothetical protein
MSEQDFIKKCEENGISQINAKQAWEKLQILECHIKNNWALFENLQKYEKNQRLDLRRFAAEKGFEYTTKEVDELIEIIGLIQKNIGR